MASESNPYSPCRLTGGEFQLHTPFTSISRSNQASSYSNLGWSSPN